jgi:hypothetical protein
MDFTSERNHPNTPWREHSVTLIYANENYNYDELLQQIKIIITDEKKP